MNILSLSEKGSALTIAIVASGVVATLLLSALNLSGLLNKQAAKEQAQVDVENLRRYVETLLSEESSCTGFGDMKGITFVDPADGSEGKNKFSLATLLSGEQEIRATTTFKSTGGELLKVQGPPTPSELTAFNATINRFYIANALSLGGSDYQADVFLQASSRGLQFAPRQLGTLLLSFVGSDLVSCKLKQAAQVLCEDMGCKYNIRAAKRKCACGLPAMSCPSASGQPMRYIAGIDASTSPPSAICASFKVSCLDRKGPGFAIAGVDANGEPICQPFEGIVAASLPPVASPTSTPAPPTTPLASPTPTTPAPTPASGNCHCDVAQGCGNASVYYSFFEITEPNAAACEARNSYNICNDSRGDFTSDWTSCKFTP